MAATNLGLFFELCASSSAKGDVDEVGARVARSPDCFLCSTALTTARADHGLAIHAGLLPSILNQITIPLGIPSEAVHSVVLGEAPALSEVEGKDPMPFQQAHRSQLS